MFIKNFGQFWRFDEIDWFPGKGARGAFRLVGRQGKNRGAIRLADFRHQQGIYILYGNHGPYYTGLTTKQGLGQRLKDHSWEADAGEWDRFSWFGFKQVLLDADKYSMCRLRDLPRGIPVGEPLKVIRDVEALLIRAMGLSNIAQPRFEAADEWFQVKAHEIDRFMGRVE